MNRAIRVLAAVTLVLVVLAVLLNPVDPAPRFGPADPVQQALVPLALFHAYLLGFATGVVVLVAVAQRHHWRWLVPLAPVAALSAYGPIAAVFLVPVLMRSQVGGASTSYRTVLLLELASTLSFPTLLALIALSYTVRGRPRAADPDLEVTSIGEPDRAV